MLAFAGSDFPGPRWTLACWLRMILTQLLRIVALREESFQFMEGELMSEVNLSVELRGCDFGDARLNKRACKIIDILCQKPNISIPAAFTTRADIEPCYRLMSNEKVTPEKIIQPHIEATYKRIENEDYVLIVQDTTETDLTRPQQQVDGAGPMDSEARRGGFMNRPKNDPGTQTLWVGLQRCYDLSTAWNAFGPGAKNFSTA